MAPEQFVAMKDTGPEALCWGVAIPGLGVVAGLIAGLACYVIVAYSIIKLMT
jgi:hypothetical protein